MDHVQRLREVYGPQRVVAGAIRSDTERVAPGHIVHRVWHVPQPADGNTPSQVPMVVPPPARDPNAPLK